MRLLYLTIILGLFVVTFLPVTTAFQSVDLDNSLLPPSIKHPMGTDELGREIYSRVLRGLGLSLRVSIAAWFAALVLGLFIGSLAGYFVNGWFDKTVNWVISLAYILPFMFFL
ncbi:ABC transporter permease, partial [candidate division KSB1 bacterium]|nr:ABC transporter permease [candidate division KSB1 bacterium]